MAKPVDPVVFISKALNRTEYRDEVSKEIREYAKLNNIVIVYGGSDDLMYLDGALDEELGASKIWFKDNNLLTSKCDDDCPYFREELEKAKYFVEPVFGKKGYTFVYDSNIPFLSFEVLEGKEKYCMGIVFSLDEVSP